MAVKKGYKQTEVGVIPEDWEVMLAGNLVDLLTGFPFPSSQYTNSGIRLLRGSNVKRNRTDWSDEITQYWPFVHGELRRYLLRDGDIVIAMDGSLVGRSFASIQTDDLPALLLQRVARVRSDIASQKFLKEWFCSQFFTDHCDAVKTTTAIPHISPADIKAFKIPLPPTLAEQEAIAGALSDADAWIESLEQLIAKKRQIKQGAMQELLTGKRRLPGFSGKWETKRLGDIGDVDPENLDSATHPYYGFRYISLEDVDCGTLRGHSEQIFRSAPSRARRKLRKNDILVSTVRPNLLSHLLFKLSGEHWVCSTGFCVVRCTSGKTEPYFVFSHLFTDEVKQQIETLLTGSNYPAINSYDVRALRIPMPYYGEQTAIATVLSDMDAEIDSLESKLAKAREIKQGMMQELLTGRIRLV
jgi:type I restriction enzyme S subunit